jgi:hypothetical protein
MNINIQKVSEVVIRDANGKETHRFKLGMASLVTMRDKSKVLELGVAPEERPLSKWQHKDGDEVLAIRKRTGNQEKGIVSRMDESQCYIIPEDGDGFYCFNANVQKIKK